MKLIVICGATATGKSDLAVEVAKAIDAQVVNADSMQLYKGMDIGTAKLTLSERKGIEHHLIDILDVKDDANVAWYQSIARSKIDQIISSGKSVVVVGGTGLYIKAILDDLNFDFGTVRLKPRGSDGGHNGLKDIQSILNTTEYPRLRIGISRPEQKGIQVDYVLGERIVTGKQIGRAHV